MEYLSKRANKRLCDTLRLQLKKVLDVVENGKILGVVNDDGTWSLSQTRDIRKMGKDSSITEEITITIEKTQMDLYQKRKNVFNTDRLLKCLKKQKGREI